MRRELNDSYWGTVLSVAAILGWLAVIAGGLFSILFAWKTVLGPEIGFVGIGLMLVSALVWAALTIAAGVHFIR